LFSYDPKRIPARALEVGPMISVGAVEWRSIEPARPSENRSLKVSNDLRFDSAQSRGHKSLPGHACATSIVLFATVDEAATQNRADVNCNQ
jgi:hypothetical protein